MREFFIKIFNAIKAFFQKIFHIQPETEPVKEFPDPEINTDPFPIVCYYGCPNSKKAQKLQLGKKLYKSI